MKQKDTVAVIVACYNSAQFLREALDSAFRQSFDDFHVYCVDDGSSDDTREIIETYRPNITLLSHPNGRNLGTYASHNLGIRSSNSKYIAFLDHDDMWCPDKLKDQVAVMESDAHIGLVYSNGWVINEANVQLFKLFSDDYLPDNTPEKILMDCSIRTPSSYIARRSVISAIGGFDSNLRWAGDHDFLIRMAEATQFRYLADPMILYRYHSGQGRHKREMWQEGVYVLKKAVARDLIRYRDVRRHRQAVLHYRLANHDITNSAPLIAGYHYALSLLNDPIRAVRTFARKFF